VHSEKHYDNVPKESFEEVREMEIGKLFMSHKYKFVTSEK
jgi:hypothetical protein